jgi:hypothetical protein
LSGCARPVTQHLGWKCDCSATSAPSRRLQPLRADAFVRPATLSEAKEAPLITVPELHPQPKAPQGASDNSPARSAPGQDNKIVTHPGGMPDPLGVILESRVFTSGTRDPSTARLIRLRESASSLMMTGGGM